MLQTIREHTQGWIAGIIISLIILSFALWGIHSYFEGGNNNPAVAMVNGMEISKNQLAIAYDRLKRQIQYNANAPLSFQDETALKTTALRALVEIEVLKQVSLAEGFLISDRQVDNYLQSMPEFQTNGHFSINRFQQVLAASHLSTNDFLNLIKTSLLIDQPKLGIVFTSFALPEEAQETVAIVNQERDIEYLTVPSNFFLKQKIVISPQQIEAYYKDHTNDFKTPEQVRLDYLEVSLKDINQHLTPSQEVLKSYYKENEKAYVSQALWKVEDVYLPFPANSKDKDKDEISAKANSIYQALKNGANFSSTAKQYSQQGLAKKGLVAVEQFPAELQKEILMLSPEKPLSPPIKTNLGYIILKLVDKKDPTPLTYDSVKDQVKIAYVRQQAEEKFAEVREKLADLTYEHPDSLDKAAKTLNLPIKHSEFFSKNKPGKDISQYKKVRNAAFTNDVLNLRNNSDVIQVDPETILVLRVNTYTPSNLLPLASMSKQIEEKLKQEEAEKLAFKTATDIKTKLQAGESIQNIKRSYPFEWHVAGYIGHYSTKVDSAILDTAFHMPHPSAEKPSFYELTKLTNGYAVVKLKGVKPGMLTDKKQYTVFEEQVQSSNGLYEYELYKLSKVKNAKVKIETT